MALCLMKTRRPVKQPASRKTSAGTKEDLLATIRRAIQRHHGKRITFHRFLAVSRLRKRDFINHFATWEEALRAAGCDQRARNAPVGTADLLDDWGAVAAKLRRIPTVRDYIVHGAHTEATFSSRFGSWSSVPAAFRAYAARKPRWKPILSLLPCPGVAPQSGTKPDAQYARRRFHRPRLRRALHSITAPRLRARPASGPPLSIPGMRNAPVNELGVICLFALLAPQLGFEIEAIQAAYPDCEARRKIAPHQWQSIRIEFEYESRNFHEHGHDPEGCDVIICWHHNWLECPKSIEVIALDQEIERLGRA
jgi:hypothetical protein